MTPDYGQQQLSQQMSRQWPFSMAHYDRNLTLSDAEIQALAIWQAQEHTINKSVRAFRNQIRPKLLRLIQPIEDVLFYCSFEEDSDANRIRACYWHLLNEMHLRKTSFWAWGEEEWTSIIGHTIDEFESTTQLFQSKHRIATAHYRQCILICAYILGEVSIFKLVTDYHALLIAKHIFGEELVEKAATTIISEVKRIGRGHATLINELYRATSLSLLFHRSPHIEAFSLDIWMSVYAYVGYNKFLSRACKLATLALYNLNILPRPLTTNRFYLVVETGKEDNLSNEWSNWIQRWYDTSTLSKISRDTLRVLIARAARWAMEVYPLANGPAQWTHDMAIAFVAMVTRMTIGQWIHPKSKIGAHQLDKPLSPSSKAHMLSALRVFFMDCQEWQWIPRTFNPQRCLATPKSITSLRAPNPRIIADDRWAKLLSAGLSLTEDDLPVPKPMDLPNKRVEFGTFYPLEMVRALVIVWLFAGLRASEIRRLRVGCISWQLDNLSPRQEEARINSKVCMLNVPINKTSTAFVKPVDKLVGEAINAWEKIRPTGPAKCDAKTGECVHFLFQWRGNQIGTTYLNHTLIPMLCRKAGVPEVDARGQITSHRARSTIATQLYNAREPMSLFELQEWLGHSSPSSTQHYAKILPTKLAKAYTDANYFSRNTRLIQVLIDQEAIRSGAAASGEPYMSYDLGHGYCTYDFFDKCPHRMACAKCSFYRPKGSSQALLLEGKSNLLWMLQEIPLSEDEREAVEDSIQAMERLCERLANVPTPSGLTPNEINTISYNYFRMHLAQVSYLHSKFSEQILQLLFHSFLLPLFFQKKYFFLLVSAFLPNSISFSSHLFANLT